MGAWGTDTFANDDAMDWVAELERSSGFDAIRAALEAAANDEGEYLDASVGSMALAAAEVVAALRGRPAASLPDEVTQWVAASGPRSDTSLAELAVRAVGVVADDPARSELCDLWSEADDDDRDAWREGVSDLRRRLA